MQGEKVERTNKITHTIVKNKKWIILSLLIIIFVAIAAEVLEKERFVFDSKVYHFLVEHRNDFLTNLFKIITNFGGAFFLITISILCMIFVKEKKYKLMIPLNLAVIAGLNIILKNIFNRPRPDELRIIDESGFSFPSGHSMASMAFYGYLIYLISIKVKNKKIRYSLSIVLGVLILLIGISRIYLGVHYTSDVIAGLCFSMAYLILMTHLEIY